MSHIEINTLDLHGVRHREVRQIVEDFVLRNDLPLRIITGNSVMMRNLVDEVLGQYDLRAEPENYWNLGSLMVYTSD